MMIPARKFKMPEFAIRDWFGRLLRQPSQLDRMEKKLDDLVKEIADVKELLQAYVTGVTNLVQTLEATVAANGGGNDAVKAAVDDLKTFAQGLTVPA